MVGYNVGKRSLSPSLRREAAEAGPSFPAAAVTSERPDNPIPIISTGLFDVDPSLFLYLPLDAAEEGTPTSYFWVRAIAGGEIRLYMRVSPNTLLWCPPL